MTTTKKLVIAAIALSVVLACIVGGTLAFLVAESNEVTNTFTYGDINIKLEESDADNDGDAKNNSYKMVPGNKIAKDPKVSVEAGSEDCYLFIKIEKSANYDMYLENYALSTGWQELTGVDGVYYREAKAGDSFYVLGNGGTGFENGYVQVKTSVTKADMELIKDSGMPTLKFTAYAVQSDNVDTAAYAWEIANP